MAYGMGHGAVIDRAGEERWTARQAAPSLVPALPREWYADRAGHNRTIRPSPGIEIDCVRHLVPPAILAIAEQRAIEADIGADQVLIAWGVISEDTYVAALSEAVGIPFEPLSHVPRGRCPLSDGELVEAAKTGMLQLEGRDQLRIVVAPRLVDSRRLVALVISGGAPILRLTTTARLRRFVDRHAARQIEHRAADELHAEQPEFSAIGGRRRTLMLGLVIIAAVMAGMAAPAASLMALELAFGIVIIGWTALRLVGLLSEKFVRRRPRILTDDKLPIYTIMIALYREAKAVPGLVAALGALNYPLEKLDIKLILESDDHETRREAERLQLGVPFEIVIAPGYGPRTKPKALNAALPFARGSFLAVFDAEDLPEPDQLRLALDAFAEDDERLACVQARLTIDNTADSWLTRLFTAEYAGLFDVFLPGLAAWRLPLPLGGSSNHFRTSVLRRLGAWDPYNVTEDADLGMRLARFGYRTAVIPSTTYEEAPARFRPWLRQRTRWFKGWMQTWLVHMRSPLKLADELGWPGFAVFQLVVGGTVLAALIHPLFAAQLLFHFTTANDTATHFVLVLYAAMLLSGYAISALLGFVGLMRRGLAAYGWVLLLMPIYWLLLSLAAWRALFQLLLNPYRWEKTEHGLARTSRLAGQRQR